MQGQRAEPRGQGEDWDQDEECEIHKESIRSFKKKINCRVLDFRKKREEEGLYERLRGSRKL